MSRSYREHLREAQGILTSAGVPDAAWDAWYLLSAVTGLDRAHYFMEQMSPMPEAEADRLRSLTESRAQRIPLQHLLGEAWFMGLPFYVNSHVLIPRQDTEKLVELVLEAQSRGLIRPDADLLDMCTGSGCIAVSLDRLGAWNRVLAADISGEALATARRNGERNSSKAEFLQSDLFASLEGEHFDVIVSNPPYIPTAVCETLMPEVRDHDPRLALDGREDGLYYYRRLAEECPRHLKKGGRVFWEIGWDQGVSVAELLRKAGFGSVEVVKDDAGKDRVVIGEWLCLTD